MPMSMSRSIMKTPVVYYYLSCLLLAFLNLSMSQRFNCSNGCVDREQYLIRAILHGEKSDPYWQQVHASMTQTARDLRIQLDITWYNEYESQTMASDIEHAALFNPDALIVTIPDATIQRAVERFSSNTTIPVFGLNTGYDINSTALDVKVFIAMDVKLAGIRAGETFRVELEVDGLLQGGSGLFVKYDTGSFGDETFMSGLTSALPEFDIRTFAIQPGTSQADITSQLTAKFANCPYRMVQLASSRLLSAAMSALMANQCTETLLGATDPNEEVYAAIQNGSLLFAISQQANLQGSLPVVLATLFATTGQTLATADLAHYGNYLTGPVLVTKSSLPAEVLQQCQVDAFPICPNTLSAVGQPSKCPCTDRKQFKIVGVTHGVTTDSFWDIVYAAMKQAATDFHVNLETVRLKPEETEELTMMKQANQIREFCKQDLDGLISSIPNDLIAEALQECLDLNVPVVSINSGAEAAQKLGLNEHIGQLEFRAGEGAGKRLIEQGVQYGYCLVHEPGNTALLDRCSGMKQAFDLSEADQVHYMGIIEVPRDNVTEYRTTVEQAINATSLSWKGVGVLLCGATQVPGILLVRSYHSSLKIGSFDTSLELFDAINEGTILFGINQNPYLQGYLPVALLTLFAYSKQELVDLFVASGPGFVESAPTAAMQQCQNDSFVACFVNDSMVLNATNLTTTTSSSSLSLGAVVGIAIASSFVLLVILFLVYRVYVLRAHIAELKQRGETVPPISIAHLMSIVVKPVAVVVDNLRQSNAAAGATETAMEVTKVAEEGTKENSNDESPQVSEQPHELGKP